MQIPSCPSSAFFFLPLLLILHWRLHVVHDKIQSAKPVHLHLSSPYHSILELKCTTHPVLWEAFPHAIPFPLLSLVFGSPLLIPQDSAISHLWKGGQTTPGPTGMRFVSVYITPCA